MKKVQPPIEAAAVKEEPVAEVAVKPAARTEPSFTKAQLRPSARKLFGISQSTYDGATASIGDERMLTVEEMRRHIDHWLKEEY